MFRAALALLLSPLMAALPGFAQYQSGPHLTLDQIQERMKQRHIAERKTLAEQAQHGNTVAALRLANDFAYPPSGMFLPDYKAASYEYAIALAAGKPEASYQLGTLYLYGKGTAKNRDLGFTLIRRAADAYFYPAMTFMGTYEGTQLLAERNIPFNPNWKALSPREASELKASQTSGATSALGFFLGGVAAVLILGVLAGNGPAPSPHGSSGRPETGYGSNRCFDDTMLAFSGSDAAMVEIGGRPVSCQ